MINHGKKIIICVIHIRSIALFINAIIENFHIEGMNKFCKIMSNDLTILQMLHSYSVWSLDEDSLLNTENNSCWIPTIQILNALYVYAVMNTKCFPPVRVLFTQGLCIIVKCN